MRGQEVKRSLPPRQIPTNRVRRFQQLLLDWFATARRDFPWRNRSATTYERVVSEVLLQRTRAETVGKFFPRFVAAFPSWTKLANASEAELRVFLEPIGLWRRRAAAIAALAEEMKRKRGRFPRKRSEIEALPGVGQYIASAILVFAHDQREPLLDVNMARVLERYFGPRQRADIRYDPYLQALSRQVVDHVDARLINWAILDLGAELCTSRNPRCNDCPLRHGCANARNTATEVS